MMRDAGATLILGGLFYAMFWLHPALAFVGAAGVIVGQRVARIALERRIDDLESQLTGDGR